MHFSRRLPASVNAEQQQNSVGSIHKRIHTLESMPALPEKNAATNLETAITRFVPIATTIAFGFLVSFCADRSNALLLE
jgi:hypothetical protein